MMGAGICLRENHHLHGIKDILQGDEGHGVTFFTLQQLAGANEAANADWLFITPLSQFTDIGVDHGPDLMNGVIKRVAGDIKADGLLLKDQSFQLAPLRNFRQRDADDLFLAGIRGQRKKRHLAALPIPLCRLGLFHGLGQDGKEL